MRCKLGLLCLLPWVLQWKGQDTKDAQGALNDTGASTCCAICKCCPADPIHPSVHAPLLLYRVRLHPHISLSTAATCIAIFLVIMVF